MKDTEAWQVSQEAHSAGWNVVFLNPRSHGPWRVGYDEDFDEWNVYSVLEGKAVCYADGLREFDARAICEALNRYNVKGLGEAP